MYWLLKLYLHDSSNKISVKIVRFQTCYFHAIDTICLPPLEKEFCSHYKLVHCRKFPKAKRSNYVKNTIFTKIIYVYKPFINILKCTDFYFKRQNSQPQRLKQEVHNQLYRWLHPRHAHQHQEEPFHHTVWGCVLNILLIYHKQINRIKSSDKIEHSRAGSLPRSRTWRHGSMTL